VCGLRHTLCDRRGEWQQRIQAVLYHHGCPRRRSLMTADARRWLQGLPLPECAREQVAVAIAMVDALEVQIGPLDKRLRAYARRQPGCRALIAHYGIGELTAVTILAELGDARRFSNSRDAVRYAGPEITVKQSDQRRAPGHLSRQGPPALRWALYEAAQVPRHPRPGPRLLPEGRRAHRWQPGVPGGRPQAAQAQLPHPPRARRGGTGTRMTPASRAPSPSLTPMHRGRLPDYCCRHPRVDGLERPSGRNRIFLRDHPINHHVADSPHGRSRTEISPGARAHRPSASASTAPVKRFALGPRAALG